MNLLKVKIMKEHKKIFDGSLKVLQNFMPKMFHDPCKNPSALSPTYLLYGP